jgi:hypothetical protein
VTLGSSVALDGEVVIEGGRFVGSLAACQPDEHRRSSSSRSAG